MEVVFLCILSVTSVILGFTTFNLLRKNEKQEDILAGYWNYLDRLSRTIDASDKKLKEIDQKGTFKSDDEVGYFFKSIQDIQEILNDFKLKEIKWYLWQLEKEDPRVKTTLLRIQKMLLLDTIMNPILKLEA